MLRTIRFAVVAYLATLFLAATPTANSGYAANFNTLFNAVRPLQANADGGVFCTATQINKDAHWWLTAAHCVADGQDLFIGDSPASIIAITPIEDGDMAILLSTAHAPQDVKLAARLPNRGDRVSIVGFPAGIGPILTQGFVGNPLVFFHYYNEWLMSLDVSVCGGNSGSAVVNRKDEVISVLIRYHTPDPPCMALAGGTPYAKLKAFAGPYFRRS